MGWEWGRRYRATLHLFPAADPEEPTHFLRGAPHRHSMPELGLRSVPEPPLGPPSQPDPRPEDGAFGRQSAPRVSFRDPLVSEGGPRRTLSAPPAQRRRPRSPPPRGPMRRRRHRHHHDHHHHHPHHRCHFGRRRHHQCDLGSGSDSGSCSSSPSSSSSESSEEDGYFLGERIPLSPHLCRPVLAQDTAAETTNSPSPQLPGNSRPGISRQARDKNCIVA